MIELVVVIAIIAILAALLLPALSRAKAIESDLLSELVRPNDARRRHNNRLNVVFCDGHVEGPGIDVLFYEKTDASVRRWNADNEPHREGWPLLP